MKPTTTSIRLAAFLPVAAGLSLLSSQAALVAQWNLVEPAGVYTSGGYV
jgi:hypothetical protein